MPLMFPKILVGNIRGIMSPMFPKNSICMVGPRFSRFYKNGSENENKKNINYKKNKAKNGQNYK